VFFLPVWVDDSEDDDPVLRRADGSIVDTWREDYPYTERLGRDCYEPVTRLLQVELRKLQYWIKDTGCRIVVLFEGRDAAGKGSTIKRFTEHMDPRGARVVALEIPTEQERGQWYFQRYVAHLPTAGEIVMFDRSWYNRATVEPVMGFCTQQQTETFRRNTPGFEKMLIDEGIALTKFWRSTRFGSGN
jgi:polyphosphate kinase 2 (PPK2 family)